MMSIEYSMFDLNYKNTNRQEKEKNIKNNHINLPLSRQ